MKRIGWISGLVALALMALPAPVFAQSVVANTVATCGTPNNTPVVGNSYPITMDTTGVLCTAGGGGGGGTVTIAGTLPAYASPPTFNFGTLNGAATAALQSSVQKTLGAVTGNASFFYDSTGAPVDWSTTPPLTAGTAIIGKVGIDQTTDGTTNAVHLVAGTALAGKFGIDQTTDGTTNAVHLVAGTALAGKFGIDQTTAGTTNAVVPVAAAVGGATAYGLQTAASTNSTSVKGSAGTLYGMSLINTTTTIYYLRMYDASSAPTCSSATGFSRTWPIPPASAAGLAGGVAPSLPNAGVAFTTGIAFCVTGGPSSTDNTSAATGVFVNLDYK